MDWWKAKIAQLELGGIHIFVQEGIERELMDFFSADGFPTYVFIDKKGVHRTGVINRISTLDKEQLAELIQK